MTNTLQTRSKPILFLDIDGVFSLFDFDVDERPPGAFHNVEGLAHFLSATAAEHLQALGATFELVWCSGWEERANEHLPHLLGLPGPLPYLKFVRSPGRASAHWKLAAVEAHAGERPLAWVDDSFNEACHEWAARRSSPTLLVPTSPATGLTDSDVRRLAQWAGSLSAAG
jgi:hypothetical protein